MLAKNGNLREPGNQNEIKLMKTDGELDVEDGGPRRKHKRQKCENLKPHTDLTNDSIYSCTSTTRNIDNGIKKVTNTETNTVTTNDGVDNGEAAEAEAEMEMEPATNSAKYNSSNNGIGKSTDELHVGSVNSRDLFMHDDQSL